MNRLRWFAVAALVVGSLIAERFVEHAHDYWFYGIPGFFVLFGFIGCAVIIFFSKSYGKYVVERDEEYYRRHGDDDEHRALTRPAADRDAEDRP